MASPRGKLVLCVSIIGVVLAIGSAIAVTKVIVELRHTFLQEAADHAGWEHEFRKSSLHCAELSRARSSQASRMREETEQLPAELRRDLLRHVHIPEEEASWWAERAEIEMDWATQQARLKSASLRAASHPWEPLLAGLWLRVRRSPRL